MLNLSSDIKHTNIFNRGIPGERKGQKPYLKKRIADMFPNLKNEKRYAGLGRAPRKLS